MIQRNEIWKIYGTDYKEMTVRLLEQTELAALAGLWFREGTDYAYVEPVCTVPAYRGRGIAAALLSEAFNRAKALGAKTAYVISDLPFYEKLGFETVQLYTFYRKASSSEE